MNLRIARKIDAQCERGLWRHVYSNDQLQRAERRLLKAWMRRCPVIDHYRKVTPDYFAANRVSGRRIRQTALKCIERERRVA